MKLIKLSRGLFTKVDDSDYEELNKHKWFAISAHRGTMFYAARNVPISKGKQKTLKMHRAILELTDSNIHGDHEDGDTLNNQRHNLRICNNALNSRNKTKQKKESTSIYKGVVLHRDRFEARIAIDGKLLYLGSSKNEKVAAKIYNDGAIRHHGEFAKLNVID